ncbi:hypothetical protein [Edaphobacter aggregans]|nr:hypothetical protein [Edaphobacter aggregans]
MSLSILQFFGAAQALGWRGESTTVSPYDLRSPEDVKEIRTYR